MSRLIPLAVQWDIVRRISRDPVMEPGIDVGIAIALFDHWDDDKRETWLAYDRACQITGKSSRSVCRSIDRLSGRYFEKVSNAGRHRSPRFRPILEAERLPPLATFDEKRLPSVSQKDAARVAERVPSMAPDSTLGIPHSESVLANARTARVSVVPTDFDVWIDAYPNPVDLAAAEQAFRQARRKATLEDLIAAARRYAQNNETENWLKPANWLGQERWRDRTAAPKPGSYMATHLLAMEMLGGGADARAPEQPDDALWRARVAGFTSTGFWLEDRWGPRPGNPGCKVPLRLDPTIIDDAAAGHVAKAA